VKHRDIIITQILILPSLVLGFYWGFFPNIHDPHLVSGLVLGLLIPVMYMCIAVSKNWFKKVFISIWIAYLSFFLYYLLFKAFLSTQWVLYSLVGSLLTFFISGLIQALLNKFNNASKQVD
jgi:hypothetical protein